MKHFIFILAIMLAVMYVSPAVAEGHDHAHGDEDGHDHGDEHDHDAETEAGMDDHGHDHDDEDHSHDKEDAVACACVAATSGFTINCNDDTAMLAAWNALDSNNCSSSCSSDVCRNNFFNIRAHHDHCLEGQVPGVIEKGIHDLEGGCEECSVPARADPNLLACPEVSCDNANAGNEAYAALVAASCQADCNTAGCAENYQVLDGVHDNCPATLLSVEAEKGFHDFEIACQEVAGCNPPDSIGPDEDLICEGVTTPTSGVATTSGAGAPVFLPAVSVIAAAIMVAL